MEDTIGFIAVIMLFGFIFLVILMFIFMGFVGLFKNIKLKIRGNRSGMEDCNSCGRRISRSARICPHCGMDYGSLNGVYSSILGCIFMIVGMTPLAMITVLALLDILKDF